MLESDYAYTPTEDLCSYDATKGLLNVVSYKQISGTTSAMKDAVWQQPCAVAIDGGSRIFQTYKSGIITTSRCGSQLNHAVTIVGYGSNFWIVKNSWGTSWGELGYVRIGTGTGTGSGICGIKSKVMSAAVVSV